ncbi:MAG: hypothetical protein ACPGSW_06005 [Phaeobacter italicus]
MKFLRARQFLVLVAAITLTACNFDGDELREYLPSEVSSAQSIYNERDILFCAISIYQLSDSAQHMDLPLSTPDRSTSEWLELPLDGKVDFSSFAAQALFDGNDCFDREAQEITGLTKLSEYYSANRKGYFIEIRRDLILVHDTARDLIIISSRAR